MKGGSGESAGQDTRSDEADPNNLDFSLPNPGPGPDPLSLSKLDADLAVLIFHRDHLCGNCRKQVDDFCDRYDEFVEHDAEVIGVLPEPEERAADWVDHHDMPYPMLADPDATLGDRYGQAIKFGPIGRRVDLIGRMPAVAVVDVRREPELLWSHTGSNPVDRPKLDTVLRELEKFS
ncbi:MAG: peroxiredoxin family protein [Halopenitus sp.]